MVMCCCLHGVPTLKHYILAVVAPVKDSPIFPERNESHLFSAVVWKILSWKVEEGWTQMVRSELGNRGHGFLKSKDHQRQVSWLEI